jgi:hypothetical protein
MGVTTKITVFPTSITNRVYDVAVQTGPVSQNTVPLQSLLESFLHAQYN